MYIFLIDLFLFVLLKLLEIILKKLNNSYNLAVINLGAPYCGINAAIRSFVRNGISKGCKVYAINGGFDGLINGNVITLYTFDKYNF